MQVLVKPVITEKSIQDATVGKFTFIVPKDANKHVITTSVEKAFSVTVVAISTMRVKGKRQRVGKRRQEVAKPAYKKAIVTLQKGQKIAAFDMGGTS